MSDILIRGIEMPEDGSCFQIVIDDDGNVYPTVEKCIMKIGSIATAAPVPPHGRCIDADALLKKCEFVCTDDDVDIRAVRYIVIEAAPTILEAEEGE